MLTHVNKNTLLPATFTGALHEYFVKQFIKEQNPSGKYHEVTYMEQGRLSAWNAISITGSACREALLKLL
jgi:YD repeat-containing protein